MKKRHSYLLSTLCFSIFLVLSCASSTLAGTKMPAFALESVRDGRTVKSSRFDGQVLLLTFFATWCPSCTESIPILNKLHADLGDAGFSVIGLSIDRGPEMVSTYVKKKSISYPVLMAESKTTRDFGGVYGIPVAFLVNRSGNVVKKYTGFVQHRVYEKDVQSLLH